MKGFRKVILSSLIVMFLCLSMSGDDVYASSNKEVEVETVDDITTAIPSTSEYSTNFDTTYSFTLELPAIVKVTVSQSHYSYAATDSVKAIISGDELGGSAVTNGTTSFLSTSESFVQTLVLEAGTYYVNFITRSNKNPYTEGKTTVSVIAQYVDRSKDDNFGLKKAAKIKIDENVTGFFSQNVNRAYYKFDLASKSKVNISVIGDKVYDSRKAMVGTLYDSNFVEIDKINISKNGSAEILTKTLTKGTYYFSLDDSKSLSFYGINTVKVTTSKITAAAPKVTSYKAGAKSVAGTAEKGAEVYVVCNGDTFIGTVGSNGKYSVETTKLVKGKNVKVYIINDGIKSKVTTVKVK